MMSNQHAANAMEALYQVVGVTICARATKPHGTVMLIEDMRTARETPSGGWLGLVGDVRQVTSKIQRTTPRDLVHVSILAGRNRIGASKASLNGGPKLAASDDGCMSITVSGAGKGGTDIHPTAAASDRTRAKATSDHKRMGPNYSLRCPRVTVILVLLPPTGASDCTAALPMQNSEDTCPGSEAECLLCCSSQGRHSHLSQRIICSNYPSHPSDRPRKVELVICWFSTRWTTRRQHHESHPVREAQRARSVRLLEGRTRSATDPIRIEDLLPHRWRL